MANALVVQSRIARRQKHYEEAESLAEDAKTRARRDVLCKIDALIALAEIKLIKAREAVPYEVSLKRGLKLLEAARDELTTARKLNRQRKLPEMKVKMQRSRWSVRLTWREVLLSKANTKWHASSFLQPNCARRSNMRK